MVLNWAIETYGDALQLEEVVQPLPSYIHGLTIWGDLKFNPAVIKSIRVLPTPDIEGFFVARLKKTKSVAPPEPFVPTKELK